MVAIPSEDREEIVPTKLGNPLAVTIHPRAIASWSDIRSDLKLQAEIEAAHLYMVVVRPTVRACADAEGVELYSDECEGIPGYTGKLSTSQFELFDYGRKFRDISDGAWCYSHDAAAEALYDDLRVGAMDLECYLRLISWKICYVGMSYGGGYGSLAGRLLRHETILQIMDDYSGLPFDIRIIPLTCVQSALHFRTTHVESPSPNPGSVQKFVSDDGVLESTGLVGVIENILITYFKPRYNKNLKIWPASKHSRAIAALNVDSLVVDFDGSADTFALSTEHRSEPERGFVLTAELAGAQRIWNSTYPAGLGYERSVAYDPQDPMSILNAVVTDYRTSRPHATFRVNAAVG